MRSNEYYSKSRVTIVIVLSIMTSILFTMISKNTTSVAHKNNEILEFTPNYDKNFKQVILLSSTKTITEEDITEPTKTLRDIEYDISTLYLDWSQIEAERIRIAQEAEDKLKEQQELESQIRNSLTFNNNRNSSVLVEESLLIPEIKDTSFKGYMNVNKVTSRSSYQWKFLHSGNFDLYTDRNGIMMYNGYYVVAMGSNYTNYKVGSTFRITLDSGISFDVITGDEKADNDTDEKRMYRPKGNDRGEIIEFLIYHDDGSQVGYQNTNTYVSMSSEDRALGDLSSLGFQGNIIKVEKLNDYDVVNLLYR